MPAIETARDRWANGFRLRAHVHTTPIPTSAPIAGADTTWTKVSTDHNSNSVVPSLGLSGSTAVVAWTQETGPSSSDVDAVSFTTSPTQDVIGGASSKPAAAWSQIDLDQALFPAPGGGLQLVFNGTHSIMLNGITPASLLAANFHIV